MLSGDPSVQDVAQSPGINSNMLYRWKAEQNGSAGIPKSLPNCVKARLQEVEQERNILKSIGNFQPGDLKIVYAFILSHKLYFAVLTFWCDIVMETDIQPFKQFVKTLQAYWTGILNYLKAKINSGVIEGINKKIQLAKRREGAIEI